MARNRREPLSMTRKSGPVFREELLPRSPGRNARIDGRNGATTDSPGERIVELDGLRGIACLLVLAYHIMPHRLPWGWIAVDLFFVLSGYLITGIILNFHQEKHFLFQFYMRRGLRIWPIYFASVLIVAAAAPFLPRPVVPAGLPYLLTYTQNLPLYWSGRVPNFCAYLDHTWSLAIEEQFYLLWPALLMLTGRRGVVPLALALVCGSVCACAAGFHWVLLFARGDGLALGALLAALPLSVGRSDAPAGSARWRTIFAVLSVASGLVFFAVGMAGGLARHTAPRWPALTVFSINLFAFGIVGLVLLERGSGALWVLRRPRLVRIGQLSYGLYMFHYIILGLSDDAAAAAGLGGRPLWRELLNVALIFGLAALSWRYFERPILALKDRFPYRSATRWPAGPHEPAASAGALRARDASV